MKVMVRLWIFLSISFHCFVVFSPEEVVDGEVMKKPLIMSALPTEAHPVQGGSQETPTVETCNVRTAGIFVLWYIE